MCEVCAKSKGWGDRDVKGYREKEDGWYMLITLSLNIQMLTINL